MPSLGRAWDLVNGTLTHMSPGGSGYPVTIVDCGRSGGCNPRLFDGSATLMI